MATRKVEEKQKYWFALIPGVVPDHAKWCINLQIMNLLSSCFIFNKLDLLIIILARIIHAKTK